MESAQPVREHPMKVTVAETTSDESLAAGDGWIDMDVKWLVTSRSVGAEETVFGITVFPPGAQHEIHRHPNVEETEYIVKGSGVAQVGDDNVELDAGELVFVPKNEYHGFHNTSDDVAVMLWCYAGAGSLEDAGYIRREED
jgi:quercetin dioxygenase-like cupin family protein